MWCFQQQDFLKQAELRSGILERDGRAVEDLGIQLNRHSDEQIWNPRRTRMVI